MKPPFPRSNPENLRLTPFQMLTLELICRGNADEAGGNEVIDLDQLLDALALAGRATTKQSMQFMIRGLICKCLIEKVDVGVRRGWKRVGYRATQLGQDLAAPKPSRPAFLEFDPSDLDIPEGS